FLTDGSMSLLRPRRRGGSCRLLAQMHTVAIEIFSLFAISAYVSSGFPISATNLAQEFAFLFMNTAVSRPLRLRGGLSWVELSNRPFLFRQSSAAYLNWCCCWFVRYLSASYSASSAGFG